MERLNDYGRRTGRGGAALAALNAHFSMAPGVHRAAKVGGSERAASWSLPACCLEAVYPLARFAVRACWPLRQALLSLGSRDQYRQMVVVRPVPRAASIWCPCDAYMATAACSRRGEMSLPAFW